MSKWMYSLISPFNQTKFIKKTLHSQPIKIKPGFIATGLVIGYGLYSESESPSIKKIKSYYKKHYQSHDDIHHKIPAPVLTQLEWLQTNKIITSESNARLPQISADDLNIEIKRALARWNCFKLFCEGGPVAYQNFIEQQPANDQLEQQAFTIFSNLLQQLHPAAREAVEASCFITPSQKAQELAALKKIQLPSDSEKFLTDAITFCPEIYPIYNSLSSEAKQYMPDVFLQDTHGRHMLYTEGGNNMFIALKQRIKNQSLTKQAYETWFCRWVINIAGFRGHESPRGSIYLTQKNAKALLALKNELDKLWENPDHDVLAAYLKIRAEFLGINSLFLAHIGSLMRLYFTEEGTLLNIWFDALPQVPQQNYEESYRQFRSSIIVTPTYEPAVLDNLLSLGCSITEAMILHTMIKASASEIYSNGIREKFINPSTPLCFREIARQEVLKPLILEFRSYGKIFGEFKVTASGDINYTPDNKPILSP